MSDTEVDTEVEGNTKEPQPHTKSRSWFLTLNNPTEDDINELELDDWRYLTYQIEQVSTQHYHALVYYENARSWKSMKDKYPKCKILLPKRFEWVKRYVTKEESRVCGPWEYGVPPEPGRRTDLESLGHRILDGDSPLDIAVDNPGHYIRYFRGLQELSNVLLKDRTEPPKVIWLWGKSGTGKTREATESNPSFYMKDGSMWWDGYKQQQVIVIDDFDGAWPFRDFLRLLDRYPYQGQVKGGYVKINSPLIYITCEFHPSEFWSDNMLKQVTRRISEIRELK